MKAGYQTWKRRYFETTNIEKRISDLEKKTNDHDGDQRVIVDWDPDPEQPKDDDDLVIEWGEDDIIKKT